MELRLHENRDFVVSVNILTPFAHAYFLGLHGTLPCVLIMVNLLPVCENGHVIQYDSTGFYSLPKK